MAIKTPAVCDGTLFRAAVDPDHIDYQSIFVSDDANNRMTLDTSGNLYVNPGEGPKGDTGPQGPKGVQGPPGDSYTGSWDGIGSFIIYAIDGTDHPEICETIPAAQLGLTGTYLCTGITQGFTYNNGEAIGLIIMAVRTA